MHSDQSRSAGSAPVSASAADGVFELSVRETSRLFDSLDPSPFGGRDLHPRIEEYIVESVKETSSRHVRELVIHLDRPLASKGDEEALAGAIRSHFIRAVGLRRRALRRLLRRGGVSLGIGFLFVAFVYTVAHLIGEFIPESHVGALLRGGLEIVGWVALWRPLEIFLYDWWPITGERRICEALSRVAVRFTPRAPSAPAPWIERWENEGGLVAQPR